MLEKYGHTVHVAENGHQAVDAVKANCASSQRFDVILVRAKLESRFELDTVHSL